MILKSLYLHSIDLYLKISYLNSAKNLIKEKYQSVKSYFLNELGFNNQDLNELLTHLEANNVVLAGHSMGVNVTLEYAHRFPSKLKGMIPSLNK